MPIHPRAARRNRLAMALLIAAAAPACLPALAQQSAPDPRPATLDKVTVVGSLIPQTELETHQPVMTITAEDIRARGFDSVADVLQQSSVSVGGLQGGQSSAAFTQGAEAAGMFGLNPGYTKYLINGRPMLSYPALYGGSDMFNNISGIPIDIVERIEVLPGGQSSLYGSDAIAGVVNIVLKEHMQGGSLNLRGGAYSEGGGNGLRFSAARGFNALDDRLNVLLNAQFESRNPIWGYQRDLTRIRNDQGYTAQRPGSEFLVYDPTAGNAYYLMDPDRCADVAGLFGGTTGIGVHPTNGEYCGSTHGGGFRTIRNGKDSAQFYGSFTFDVNDRLQLFGDALYSDEETRYSTGSSYIWWGSASKYGRFWDQDAGRWTNIQRVFAPEDMGPGGYNATSSTDRSKAYQVTLGGKGMLGDWDYSVSFTRGEYRLAERSFVRWKDAVNDYFDEHVLGPQLGEKDGLPIFAPDWDAFYSPISPQHFARFTGHVTNRSRTWQNLGRVQLTHGSLFALPGGDAGFALVVEGGSEGWAYSPDTRLMNGEVWGMAAVAGAGHRSSHALTSELRLPLLDSLTLTGSARYDAFDVAGNTIDKPTYSLGVEFRPVQSLLLRGKYGTAFRAPTLSDAFQGKSGYYANNSIDYYRCGQLGHAPADTTQCPYNRVSVYGELAGNPELEPINADVWNAGAVWSPSQRLSFSVDYYNWEIENEVKSLSSDQLLLAEYYCRNGLANNTSASCQNVADWIIRDANGVLERIYTPKMNVSRQNLQAVTVGTRYQQDLGGFGELRFTSHYTNMLQRELQPQPGDRFIDLLKDPYNMWLYDAYAKVRADASVAWALDRWTTTLHANHIGKTPNYLSYLGRSYDYVHPESGARAGKWGSYTTYNLSVNYQALENLDLSLMVNNVFNRMPDYQARNYPGTSAAPYNSDLYNPYGRALYVQARYRFGH